MFFFRFRERYLESAIWNYKNLITDTLSAKPKTRVHIFIPIVVLFSFLRPTSSIRHFKIWKSDNGFNIFSFLRSPSWIRHFQLWKSDYWFVISVPKIHLRTRFLIFLLNFKSDEYFFYHRHSTHGQSMIEYTFFMQFLRRITYAKCRYYKGLNIHRWNKYSRLQYSLMIYNHLV